jgi:hypothetical protein
MKTLTKLYKEHRGKVSDKWSIYLAEYEEKFNSYVDHNLKLLEIGIQNGGSLEIYSKYFHNAQKILGCDINEKCRDLFYDEPNIEVIVGDANSYDTFKKITENSKFDIIIDDGSHTSSDIIKTFCLYFNELNDGGIFIIEDLHCSYWRKFSGGLFFPLSSINFFKRLVDVLNFEHWGIEKNRDWLLRLFSLNYDLDIKALQIEKIHSIEFVNSLCFIKKKQSESNQLGVRVISGIHAHVEPVVVSFNNMVSTPPVERENQWSNRELTPEEELISRKREIKVLQEEISTLKKS